MARSRSRSVDVRHPRLRDGAARILIFKVQPEVTVRVEIVRREGELTSPRHRRRCGRARNRFGLACLFSGMPGDGHPPSRESPMPSLSSIEHPARSAQRSAGRLTADHPGVVKVGKAGGSPRASCT